MRLQVNQAVSVETVGDTGQLSSAGGVVSATTIDSLSVRFPDLKAPLSGFVVGKIATLRVTSQQGVHSARSKVLQVISAPFVVLTLGAPTAFTTQQQREFFRVAVKLAVSCTIVESSEPEAVGKQDEAAKTQDISAGGMRLSTALPLRLGDRVELQVKARLPRALDARLLAQVLRVGPGEGRARGTTSAGVKFVYANQREQDAVVLLMFELQRKSLT